MKLLSIFFLIGVTLGREVSKEVDLPRVDIRRITSVDPPGFIIGWKKINRTDVLGYKVRVWEVLGDAVLHYEVVNGKKKLVPSISPQKINDNDVIPKTNPKEIIVQGADVTEAKFENAKEGVLYEIRVSGFTAEGDGPMSYPYGIKIGE